MCTPRDTILSEGKIRKAITQTTIRVPDECFTIKLPFNYLPPQAVAETRNIAFGSLTSMQRKFHRNSQQGQAYANFIRDYECLGHMELLPQEDFVNADVWCWPHRAAIINTLTSRKLRVVFDASRKTRDRIFFNDFLLVRLA